MNFKSLQVTRLQDLLVTVAKPALIEKSLMTRELTFLGMKRTR